MASTEGLLSMNTCDFNSPTSDSPSRAGDLRMSSLKVKALYHGPFSNGVCTLLAVSLQLNTSLGYKPKTAQLKDMVLCEDTAPLVN